MGSASTKHTVSPSPSATAPSPQNQDQGPQQVAEVAQDEYTEDKTQRVVLITGCSTGIGLALAALLATDSDKRFKVYATMRNLGKKEALEEKTKDLEEGLLSIKELDVCSDESVKSAVDEIVEKEGEIDILINNAGIGLFCVAECASIDTAKKVFEPNVFGLMRMTSAVIPHMKKQRAGHIINLGCVQGFVGTPFSEIYGASKFAVEGYTESLAPILGKFNIKCTLIEPGPVMTNFAVNAKSMRDEIDISGTDDETKQLMSKAIKIMYHALTNKGQTPEDVAEHCKKALLLKSPPLRYQTNDKYRLDQVAAKLSDPSGNKIVSLLTSYFFTDHH